MFLVDARHRAGQARRVGAGRGSGTPRPQASVGLWTPTLCPVAPTSSCGQPVADRHGKAVDGHINGGAARRSGKSASPAPGASSDRGSSWPGVIDGPEEPITEDGLQLYPVRPRARTAAPVLRGVSPTPPCGPLYHDVIVKPAYHRSGWSATPDVNPWPPSYLRCRARGDRAWAGLSAATRSEDAGEPASGRHHRFLSAHSVPPWNCSCRFPGGRRSSTACSS